jgi:hypothetical protein
MRRPLLAAKAAILLALLWPVALAAQTQPVSAT